MKKIFKQQRSKLKCTFKKHKFFLRSISLTLILTLLLTSLPLSGIFVSAEQTEESPVITSVIMELEQYRTEFSKTYLKSDGTLESVVSSNAIHFKDGGRWVEIDSDLEITENTEGKEVYQNKKGPFTVNLPTELESDSEVEIKNGNNKISIKLLETKNSKAKKNTDKKQKAEKLTKDRRRLMTAGELFEVDSKQLSAVEYSAAYSDTNLRYDVTPTEVKESIVLTKAPDKKTKYSYEITADGLTAVLNKDNSIDFFESSKVKGAEPVFSMPAPHMFDANDEYSYDIKTTLKNKGGKYVLTYKPSYEWLKSKERSYPVTIDPTVTVNSGIQDSYTFSGEGYGDSYTGYEQQLKVGTTAWIAPGDYWQTYLKFTDLPQIPYDSYRIDSAYLTLSPKATTGGWEEMELGVYELTEDWKNHQTGKVAERITFNNAPEDVGYSTATASVSRGGADNGVVVGFEIAHLVEKWYNTPEANFGIKLAAHLDASQWNDNLVFHSSRSTTGTAPYLSLTYTEYVPVTSVEITGKQERLEYRRTGNAFEVSATVYPENATNGEVIWESTNESAAYYSDGYIWAAGVGTTTITARSADNNEIVDSFTLEVYNIPIETLNITNCPENNSLEIGETHQLDFEVGPDNATDKDFVEQYSNVTWSSSDDSIISVDPQGVLTANSTGTAIIYAVYGDVIDTVTLTVPVTEVIAVDFATDSSISSLSIGDTVEFSGFVLPIEATDKRTVCTSFNPEVVSVVAISDTSSPDKSVTYRLTALSAGTAIVRLMAYNNPSIYKEITVNVNYTYPFNAPNNDYLIVGDSHQLIDPSSCEFISYIEDTSVVSTDGNGKITALESGTTKIYIGTTAFEGVELYEYSITVIEPVEWNYLQDEQIYCGKSFLLTNNSDICLSTTDTDKVQINGRTITALELGSITIYAWYRGEILSSIKLHILEGLTIFGIPTNNTIALGQVYEGLNVLAFQKYSDNDSEWVRTSCGAEWSSSDESIATVEYDYTKAHVAITGVSEGLVWINAESLDPASSDMDGFWLYVDKIPINNFEIVNHSDYPSFADKTAYIWDHGVLEVKTNPANAYYKEIDWYVNKGGSDSVEFIGAIEKGNMKLRVKKAGAIEIGAKIDGKPASTNYVINVKKPSATIENKPERRELYVGGTHQLTYVSDPKDVTVEWVSKNSSMATIDSTGKITAKSSGFVVIALKVTYKNHTYTTSSFTLNVRNQWIWVDGYDSTELTIGKTVNLTADVGTYDGDNKTVVWETNNSSVATVDNGLVTPVGTGIVAITAKLEKYPDVSWQVVFEVDLPAPTKIFFVEASGTLNSSQQKKLMPISLPSGSSTNFVWETENPDIAYVNNDGTITAKNIGTTKITVYSKRDPSVKAEYTLTVKNNVSYIINLSIWDEYMLDDIQVLADKYYNGDTARIEHKSIITDQDFFDAWNSIGEFNGYKAEVDFVFLHIHASPFDISGAPFPSASIFTLTREELKDKNKLAEKEMKGLALFGCNAGHLDYHYDNIATVFANAVKNAPVIAADGTVEILGNSKYECVNDETFQDLSHEIREPYGWIRYYWENGSLNYEKLGFKKISIANIPKYLEQF
ncbi:MAG: Ig-like domain-containing protein [Clostridia bacterium]|nr:Ig-like domain-containing protein [Clostridia bacterium]